MRKTRTKLSKDGAPKRRGRRATEEITAHQSRTLDAIRVLAERNGFPPTVKELAAQLGITPASVHDQLRQLERKGYITREPRKARSIVVCGDGSRPHARNSWRKRDA